jgi:hypothetical protein
MTPLPMILKIEDSHYNLEFIAVKQKSSNAFSFNHATLWLRAL